MPVVVHRFDDPADDELAALATAGCIQDIEIMLAVLSAFEFVKDGIFSKGLETLSTNETALVPDFTSCEDNQVLGDNSHFQILT